MGSGASPFPARPRRPRFSEEMRLTNLLWRRGIWEAVPFRGRVLLGLRLRVSFTQQMGPFLVSGRCAAFALFSPHQSMVELSRRLLSIRLVVDAQNIPGWFLAASYLTIR